MISVSLPEDASQLIATLGEMIRRVVDGTVKPLFVDYTNQRVIVGGVVASAKPATIEVASGNLKIVGTSNGVILPAPSGNYYLVNIAEVTNDDGTISPVFTATKQ